MCQKLNSNKIIIKKKENIMKKKYFILVAICQISLGLTAQPVITYNGNAPQIGDTYNFSGDNGSYDPGPSGANQSWDFSNIPATFSSSPTAVTPESTPFSGEFPEATIAFAQTEDNETFIFSQISTSAMLNVGLGYAPGDGGNELIIHYTDAVKLLQYPFSFSDSYTDSYYTAYSLMEGMMTHEWGNITATADAWGSVITPEETYNTLRIKKERTYTDSVWVAGVFVSANTYTQTDYEWYTSTSHSPVISISITNDGTTATYRTDDVTGVGEQQHPDAQVNIYPNPVTDRLTIQSDKKLKSIRLLSVDGKMMNDVPVTNPENQQVIDFDRYPKGIYFIEVGFNDGETVTRKIIK
jgi:hypothetical protein